jgi:hypothetical protein
MEESSVRLLRIQLKKTQTNKQTTKISTLRSKRAGTTMRKVFENRFSEKFSQLPTLPCCHTSPHTRFSMFYFEATATEYPNWMINTMLDFGSLQCGVPFPRKTNCMHSPATSIRVTMQCHTHT